MKGVTKFFFSIQLLAAVLFINTAYSNYPVSGTVRYSDDNSIVSSGTVEARDLSGLLISTAQINQDGSYSILVPSVTLDLIGIPDIGPEEDHYVPTYYPNKTDWQTAQTICATAPLTNVDIYATRLTTGQNSPFCSNVSGIITLKNKPVNNAIIYAKRDNNYYGYAITDNKGFYEINGLPIGDYILVIHRIGASSSTLNITLTMEGLNNVVLNLEEAPFFNNMTVPGNYKLGQNYPNPFNPETKIDYSVPVSGNVKLAVFNSAGQLVKELVDGFVNAGNYTASFGGTNIASGIYYYKLEANGFAETRKMILVK